jgi:adenine phosphoribosyltransferase
VSPQVLAGGKRETNHPFVVPQLNGYCYFAPSFWRDNSQPQEVATPMIDLKSLVRTIPDYPKPGIMFRDVTTLMGHPEGFKATIDALAAPFVGKVDAVAGIEARGFVFGGAVAEKLGCGFIPVRKKGKLPWTTIGQQYTLEYGIDTIEIHLDAIQKDQRILIVDDLIATGGTAEAAVKLVSRVGGTVAGCAFVIDLPELGGVKLLASHGISSHALLAFDGH